jgi:excisionase family DNA binding protein
MIPKLLNAKEVAEVLRISRSKAYLMMQQKVLPSIRMERSVRVHEEDLIQYIERNRKSISEIQLNTKSAAPTTDLDPCRVNPNLPKESSHE